MHHGLPANQFEVETRLSLIIRQNKIGHLKNETGVRKRQKRERKSNNKKEVDLQIVDKHRPNAASNKRRG